jgi:ankyrin repeat protein
MQLRQELEELGINATVLHEKRAFIVDLLQRAKADGTIDNADVPDFDLESEFSTEFSTTTTLIGEEFGRRVSRVESSGSNPRSSRARKRSNKRRLGSLVSKLFGNDLRIIEAADEGDLERILDLVSAGVNLQTMDKWDWTALHMAAYGGFSEITRVLIEEGADLDARTVDDETPLNLAEIKGHVEVVRVIEEELERRAKKAQLERPGPRSTLAISLGH